jgi:hypothetical protein
MNEQEWLESTDPQKMLEFLRGKVSNRKLRLFGVGCCRSVWHLLLDEKNRRAVEVAEEYADGRATARELEEAGEANYRAWKSGTRYYRSDYPVVAVGAAINEDGYWIWDWKNIPTGSRWFVPGALGLLRCIFGNPFRSVTIDPWWLAWNDGTIPNLAQGIYDERAFDRLPILADALEEAGCHDADILAHCRSEGPHVRGCWVVDLLLGKEQL